MDTILSQQVEALGGFLQSLSWVAERSYIRIDVLEAQVATLASTIGFEATLLKVSKCLRLCGLV
jgi:hypothetical protein